jgi:cell division protease FtsH
MNAHFRNFALWVIIALLLIALFQLFQSPGNSGIRPMTSPFPSS